MPLETIAFLAASLTGCLFQFSLWFLVWMPAVALLEYAAHRWIMHRPSRLLDPTLSQFKSHGLHHQGANDQELVDIPLKNCLLLTAPLFLLLMGIGLTAGSLAGIAIPAAALLSWSLLYTYLWTQMHRAIHGTEANWFRRCGPVFRFFRNHHLRHHAHATVNFGTVFPWTDYLFFTWHGWRAARNKPKN
ncbi:MAG TPA: sterol desaturase family protein [Pirellulaceae bacterium]|nr:sterol desaturase family protein [Pirellulaceae bacterium]